MLKNLKISQKLLIILIIAIIPLILFSTISFKMMSASLEHEVLEELTAIREAKAMQIEDYFDHIREQIVMFSKDPTVITAAENFTRDFRKIRGGVTQGQNARLRDYYAKDFFPRYNKEGDHADESAGQFVPSSARVKRLQYLYIAGNANAVGSKDNLKYAKDGSSYSRQHKK